MNNCRIIRLLSVVLSLLLTVGYYQLLSSEEDHVSDYLSTDGKRLSPDILDRSLVLGQQFLLNNQNPEGNFTYEYDFVTQQLSQEDNQVRQAGALWGLALIHHNNNPAKETQEAIEKGLAFFDKNSRETEDGRKYTVYPGEQSGRTGTVALVVLTLVDFLRAEGSPQARPKHTEDLDKYLKFLLSLRMNNGQFRQSYRFEDGLGTGFSSPYFDGESLLALIKAAKYLGYSDLKEIILESAEKMYYLNIEQALKKDPDSDITKGFYQWSSMAYYELYTTGWQEVDQYAQRVIELAYWMIDVHETLQRTKNTAYAHEGLASAWELARLTNNRYAMQKIGRVIDVGLYKLISWQVGGPIENRYLRQHRTDDPKAIGGVMNSKANALLRVDVTQHQMHAVILARRYIYRGTPDSATEKTTQPESRNVWFDDVQTPLSISAQEREQLGHFIASLLLPLAAKEGELPSTLAEDSSPRIVFLSVSDGMTPANVVMGISKGIGKALEQAISKAHTVHGSGYQPKWIKFDIVQDVYSMGEVKLNRPMVDLERSLEGIAFERQSGIAFLPEELVAYTLVNGERRLQKKNTTAYLEKRPTYSGQLQPLLDAGAASMYRFTTMSLFIDGHSVTPLYRGHPVFNPEQLSRDGLLSSARLAGRYLTNAVDMQKGRFTYIYRPKTCEVSAKYNILRHAGTIYSMLELYETTGEKELLEASRRAIEYLVQAARPCPTDGENMVCIVEGRYFKLGGNALAAVALAKYTEITKERQHMPLILKLCHWIQSVQDEETGRFLIHKETYPDGEVTDFVSQYYPGEALLALTRVYALDHNETWLDVAEKGAEYLIQVRDRDYSFYRSSNDQWLLSALNELYRYRPKPLYLDYAARVVRIIGQTQNREPKYPDWLGGYYSPPRSTPAATRTEGLCASYKLLRDFGRAEDAAAILAAIKLGVAFQLQTQFGPESVLYLRTPERALGAFHHSLTNYEIRLDYVQHNISALLGLYNIMGASQEQEEMR